MKWETANIYYITFKKDRAAELFAQILHAGQISNNLRIKTYLSLANLGSGPKAYYEHALAFVDNTVEKDLLSELYFKYGLLLDESSQTEQAVQFYKKCIELNSGPYLSSAFSNIAAIFEEIGKYELAIKYSLESLRIDEHTKNCNGIYISSMKLAEVYTGKNPEKALEYYKKAKACAKELNEPFYIASVNTALGDFYLNGKDRSAALKYYEEALQIAQNHFSKDNIAKIEMRIREVEG
jgi:tetratricopeptide (TPR) repeat protein